MLIETDPEILLARARAAGLALSDLVREANTDWGWLHRFVRGTNKTAPRLDKVMALNQLIIKAEKRACADRNRKMLRVV